MNIFALIRRYLFFVFCIKKEKIRLGVFVGVFKDRQIRHSLGKGKAVKQKLTGTHLKQVSTFILNLVFTVNKYIGYMVSGRYSKI